MTSLSAGELITQPLPCRLDGRTGSGLDSAEGSEPPEPSWELPPELQEFSGNKGDRHALLQFKQQQQVGAGFQVGHGSLESTRPILHGEHQQHITLHTLWGKCYSCSYVPASSGKGACLPSVQPTFATGGPCRQLGLKLTLNEPSGRRISAGGPKWISSDGASNRRVQP